MATRNLIFLCLLLLPALCHAAPLTAGLSDVQIGEIKSGKLICLTESIEGKAWPRMMVYQFVAASPVEVMAVFSHYGSAHGYVPNVVVSRITKEFSPWDKQVFYELDIPILPNEEYTARNVLSKSSDGARLVATWTAGEAKFFKSSVGNMALESWNGGTLLRYTNLVDPGSKVAGLLKGHAKKQVEDTVRAITKQVMNLKTKHPEQLEKKVKALESVLAGMPG